MANKRNADVAAVGTSVGEETFDEQDVFEETQDLEERVDLAEGAEDDDFFINFDEVPDANVLVEPGTYEAFIAFAEKLKGTKAPYAPYINIRWKIDDANAVDNGAQGRVIFDSLSWHPNALSMCRAKLEGIGFPKGYKGRITTDMLQGERALIVVKTRQPKADDQKDENGEAYPPKSVISKIKPLRNRATPADL